MHSNTRRARTACVGLIVGVAALCAVLPVAAADWRMSVQLTPGVHKAPYSGRVYLFFSRIRREPRHDPDWFHPEQFIARDVTNWQPNQALEFRSGDPRVLAYPRPLGVLELDGSRTQAVVRFNPFERKVGDGPG